jgi:hypothetical protein
VQKIKKRRKSLQKFIVLIEIFYALSREIPDTNPIPYRLIFLSQNIEDK